MAVAMIGPNFYAWDRNGKPLAFGKLYTYQARTNTPKETYQSEDQVVANSNPVILNGEGYANVYLDGSYKMVLKDSDENEIWSADPVTSNQANEWLNCFSALYVSPTTLKVSGNQTDIYSAGRKVRLDNAVSEFSYSLVVNSSYASGETSIELSEPVVLTSVNSVCASVVSDKSSFSGEDVALYTDYVFSTINNMKSGIVTSGLVVEIKEGQSLRVNGESDLFSCYIATTETQDVELDNGLYAKKLSVSDDNLNNEISDLKLPLLNSKYLGIAWQKLANGNSVTIVCQGDSMTAGYDTTSDDVVPGDSGDAGGPTHAPITYPSALQTMLSELVDSPVTVIKQAKSGDDASESFARWTSNPNADVFHFMFGINDAAAYGIDAYLDNMEALIKRAIGWGSGVVIHSTTAINFNNKQEDSILFSQAVETLARQYNCPYFDAELVTQYGKYDGIYSDGIHFNKQGYHKFGRAVGSFILAGGWARGVDPISGNYSQQAGRQSKAIGFHKKGNVTFLNDEVNSYLVQGGGAIMKANSACSTSFSFFQSTEYMSVSCVGLLGGVVFGIAKIASETLPQYATRGADSLNRITAKSRSSRAIIETTGLQIEQSRNSQQGQQSLLGYSVGKGWKTIYFTLDGTQTSDRFVSGLILNQVDAKRTQQTVRANGGAYTEQESYNLKFPYWDITDDTDAIVTNSRIPAEVEIPLPDALRTWISGTWSYFFDAMPVQVDVTKYQPSGFYRFVLQRHASGSTQFFVHTLHNTNTDVVLTGAEIKAIDKTTGSQVARFPSDREDAVLILKFTNSVNAYYDINVTAQSKQGQGSWLG